MKFQTTQGIYHRVSMVNIAHVTTYMLHVI